jgi:anti-sigma factor RsiW
MNCSPSDLRDYLLGELAEEERRLVEKHVDECHGCREELDRLSLTQAALHSLRDEEMPRRIAFVSDKVFEPRWWQRVWASGPRLGFASASVLAAAIMVHAFIARPIAQAPVAVEQARIEAEVGRRVEATVASAVEKAVAASEERQARKSADLLAAVEKKMEFQRRADQGMFEESLLYLQKKMNSQLLASAEMGGAR